MEGCIWATEDADVRMIRRSSLHKGSNTKQAHTGAKQQESMGIRLYMHEPRRRPGKGKENSWHSPGRGKEHNRRSPGRGIGGSCPCRGLDWGNPDREADPNP